MIRALFAALLCLVSTSAFAIPPGDPLPSGYLSTSGNQIVDGAGNFVRLACIGYNEPTGNYSSDMATIRNAGFNCARYPWTDVELNLTTMDQIVAAAQANSIKIIFDHHANEGKDGNNGCLSQQANGLWYDKNSTAPHTTTDNTDGCGTPGTITYETFKANWVTIATHFANNSTVIGFDLHNEPITYGDASPRTNWGGKGQVASTPGNGSDILAMYNDVGAAINAVNPGALIICEGIINIFGYLDGAGGTATGFDLTLAQSNPVTAAAGKVIYSVHEYPKSIGGQAVDSGSAMQATRTRAWGFLVINNCSPIYIGEMGADLDNTNGQLVDEQAWADDLRDYVNGLAGGAGGPTFSGTQQGIGITWWNFGYNPGQTPDGFLNSDGTLKSGQQTYWSAMLYHQSATPGARTAWNPNDKSVPITLTNSNLTASSSGTGSAQSVRSTTSKASGKLMFEVTASTISADYNIGLATSTFDESTPGQCGTDLACVGYYPVSPSQSVFINGAQLTSGAVADTSGATLTIAVDLGAKLLWASSPAMRTAGNAWNNSPTANPATGVGGVSMSSMAPGPYFIIYNNLEGPATAILNTQAPFSIATPTGYSAWDPVVTSIGRPISVILGANELRMFLPVGYNVR